MRFTSRNSGFFRHTPLTLALGALFLVAACDSSSTSPDPDPIPASVELSTQSVLLTQIGETHEITATVLDAAGAEIPNATVTWASSNEDVAVVSAEGVVEAVGAGVATVTASTANGELSAGAEVTVELDDENGDDDEDDEDA